MENNDLNKALRGGPIYYSKPSSYINSFYLYDVTSPEDYTDWFDIIRGCTENDVVKIHINSPGGNLFAAIQLMRVLAETQATVICSVEGECMSAATMIFLQADILEVSDHCMFMFHNYSGGTFGKGGEMLDQLNYEREWSETLLREVYADFLSTEEIDSILNNKDIWMTGKEVVKRIEQKAEKLEMRLAEEDKEEKE